MADRSVDINTVFAFDEDQGGKASTHGYRGVACASGNWGDASAEGYYSAACVTGHRGKAFATGKASVALGAGFQATAAGKKRCALFLVERDMDGNILDVWAGIVGRDGVKPLTTYRLINGKPVEVSP